MKHNVWVLLLSLLFTACGLSREAIATQTVTSATVVAASWTQTPTPTGTPTTIPTPTVPFRVKDEVVEEWVNGRWQEVKPPEGIDATVSLGEDGIPQLITSIDPARFDSPTQGVVIAKYENGQWQPQSFTLNQKIDLVKDREMHPGSYPEINFDNNGLLVQGLKSDILSVQAIADAQGNYKLQFITLGMDNNQNLQILKVEPIRVSTYNQQTTERSIRTENGKLTLAQVNELINHFQDSIPEDEEDFYNTHFLFSHIVFTPSFDTNWLKDRSADEFCAATAEGIQLYFEYCSQQLADPARPIRDRSSFREKMREFIVYPQTLDTLNLADLWQNAQLMDTSAGFFFEAEFNK